MIIEKTGGIVHIIYIILLINIFSTGLLSGQYSAEEVIQKSIRHHDPDGILEKNEVTFHFTETRPKSSNRKTKIVLHPKRESFEMHRVVDGNTVCTMLNNGEYSHTVNEKEPNAAEIKKYLLTDERSDMMRTYYHYLWYMPMKLMEPGTIIHNEIDKVDFFGKESLQVKVTYDPAVGDDIWYFYFDPKTYALCGYRFYHDEAANDGEYILFDSETNYKSLRIPKSRTWYTHQENKLLGTDILERMEVK